MIQIFVFVFKERRSCDEGKDGRVGGDGNDDGKLLIQQPSSE
jgi:hypothetical protein